MKTNLILIAAVLVSGCSLTAAEVVTKRPPDAQPVLIDGGGAARLTVERVAHASVLLELGGATVLTDPWFSERAAYHHGEPLGRSIADLPKLDAVVVSHGHYDHFDIETFAAYADKDVPMFVADAEMVAQARAVGFTHVQVLAPWSAATVGGVTITAAPAEHGVPEVTFVIQGGGFTVFFGGDSLLVPGLRDELPKRFPDVDLALPAVNGLSAVGKQVVMNADEAATLAGLLRAKVAVPTHYTFKGSAFTDAVMLRYDGDAKRFEASARERAPQTQVRILAPGERLAIEKAAVVAR